MTSNRLRMLGLSALIFFVELFFLRWLPGYVRYLAYFTNLLLLGMFLGLGCGLLASSRGSRTFPWFPAVFTLLVAITGIGWFEIDTVSSERIYYESAPGDAIPIPAWSLVLSLLTLLAFLFFTLGEELGRVWRTLASLEGYGWNLIGSLVGIGLFSAISR